MNQDPYQPYNNQQPQEWPPQPQPLPQNTQWGQQPYPPQYAQPEYYVQPGTYYRPPSTMMPPQNQWQQPSPGWQPEPPHPAIKKASNALRNYLIVTIILTILSFGGIRIYQLQVPSLPLPIGTWTTTQTFTGTRIQKTAIFNISSDWKLFYTCAYQQISGAAPVEGALAVVVYGADGAIEDVAVNAVCKDAKDTGETEEHIGGNIYLSMNGTGDWTIQIQELK
jgi:hypothetical protein